MTVPESRPHTMSRKTAALAIAALVVLGWAVPAAAIQSDARGEAPVHTADRVVLQNVTVNAIELDDVVVRNATIGRLVVREIASPNDTDGAGMEPTGEGPTVLRNVTIAQLELSGLSLEDVNASGTGVLEIGRSTPPGQNETNQSGDGPTVVGSVTIRTLTVGTMTVGNVTLEDDRTGQVGVVDSFVDFIRGIIASADATATPERETPTETTTQSADEVEPTVDHLVVENVSVAELSIGRLVVRTLEPSATPTTPVMGLGEETAVPENATVLEAVSVQNATIDRMVAGSMSARGGNETTTPTTETPADTPTETETETPTEPETETETGTGTGYST